MARETSGEKTEKPSAKKKRDARRQGNVSKSQDLISAGTLVIMFALMMIGFEGLTTGLAEFTETHMRGSYINTYAGNFNIVMLKSMLSDTVLKYMMIILPVLLVAMLAGVILNLVQTGFLFAPDKLKPNFNKINPIEGFKRVFSLSSIMELFKALVKTAILVLIIYKTLMNNLDIFGNYAFFRPGQTFAEIMKICAKMGITIGAALLVFAIVDVVYQWWKYQKDLRMTKQEVKEEYKQTEGDPQIKGRIRQLQRQMSQRRMMQAVPTADVVITNPTHFAVALRYREDEDAAPVVVAKGADYVAQRIKEIAKENGVTIVENKPVARSLFASCEIGQTIPADMYQAVADILVYVYKATNRTPKRREQTPNGQ